MIGRGLDIHSTGKRRWYTKRSGDGKKTLTGCFALGWARMQITANNIVKENGELFGQFW